MEPVIATKFPSWATLDPGSTLLNEKNNLLLSSLPAPSTFSVSSNKIKSYIRKELFERENTLGLASQDRLTAAQNYLLSLPADEQGNDFSTQFGEVSPSFNSLAREVAELSSEVSSFELPSSGGHPSIRTLSAVLPPNTYSGFGEGSSDTSLLPVLPVNYQNVTGSINGTLDGSFFLGVLFPKDSCISVWNFFAERINHIGTSSPLSFAIPTEAKNGIITWIRYNILATGTAWGFAFGLKLGLFSCEPIAGEY
jgi:hypothetical protein